jgi:hypothetical protein
VLEPLPELGEDGVVVDDPEEVLDPPGAVEVVPDGHAAPAGPAICGKPDDV